MLCRIRNEAIINLKKRVFAHINVLQIEEQDLVKAANRAMGYESCITLPADKLETIMGHIEEYVDQKMEDFSPSHSEELAAIFLMEKKQLAHSTAIRLAKADLAAIAGKDEEQKKPVLQLKIDQAEHISRLLDQQADTLYKYLSPDCQKIYNETFEGLKQEIERNFPAKIWREVNALEKLVSDHINQIRQNPKFHGRLYDIPSAAAKSARGVDRAEAGMMWHQDFIHPVTNSDTNIGGAAGAAAQSATASAAGLPFSDHSKASPGGAASAEAQPAPTTTSLFPWFLSRSRPVAAAQPPASAPPCDEEDPTPAAP